jgi:hypothetical protein
MLDHRKVGGQKENTVIFHPEGGFRNGFKDWKRICTEPAGDEPLSHSLSFRRKNEEPV